jgi:molybdopterin-guanine dinucleotide biosynthesis protein A
MDEPAPAALHGGILVGGASRRMGTTKALLVLDGVTFFERVARALAPVVERTVVLGRGELPSGAERFVRLDDVAVPGPLGGLLAAFTFAPEAAWIVAPCDLPLLTVEAFRWLVAQRSPRHWAVLPRLGDGRVEPLAALYEPGAGEHLQALAASGRFALQPLAELPGVLAPTPPPELAPCWSNVNTPDELARVSGKTTAG